MKKLSILSFIFAITCSGQVFSTGDENNNQFDVIDTESYSKYGTNKMLTDYEKSILSEFEKWSYNKLLNFKNNNSSQWESIKKNYCNKSEYVNITQPIINQILLPDTEIQKNKNNGWLNSKAWMNTISDGAKYVGIKDYNKASNHEMLTVFRKTFVVAERVMNNEYHYELLKEYFNDIVFHNIENIINEKTNHKAYINNI